MGVMSCSKSGCDNIMCSRYADNIGYICHECFNEISEYQQYNPKIDIDDIKIWIDEPKSNKDCLEPLVVLEHLFYTI